MMRRSLAAIGVVLVLAGCSDTDGDGDVDVDPVVAAEERVERAESALTDAQDAFASAGEAFCGDAADYIEAVDRYGGAVSDAEATVGDVTTAGADLERPRDAVGSSADEATAARDELAAAEQELADAEADLAALVDSTTVPTDDETTTTEPLVPPATVTRVEQAESDLADAFEGIDDDTPLADATEQVNAAAFAVQVAWLRLFADAGCLDDDRQAEAVAAVADYTAALQTSLATAGYFEGTVDGVYGPETVDAVERLQQDAGLPVTGLVDRATAEALEQAVIDAGGAAETEAIVQTAALQSLLAVAGYWTGPIDGEWSDALTAALQQLQTDLGVPPTGEVDADTLDALQRAIEEGREPSTTTTTEPAPDATTTVPTDDETTTTGA